MQYIVKAIKDDGAILHLGNFGDYTKDVLNIDIDRKNRVGVANIELDNLGAIYTNEFLELNEIEIYFLNTNATGPQIKNLAGQWQFNKTATEQTNSALDFEITPNTVDNLVYADDYYEFNYFNDLSLWAFTWSNGTTSTSESTSGPRMYTKQLRIDTPQSNIYGSIGDARLTSAKLDFTPFVDVGTNGLVNMYLGFWCYVSDITQLKPKHLEITTDSNNYRGFNTPDFSAQITTNGWNYILIDSDDITSYSNKLDTVWDLLNRIEIYATANEASSTGYYMFSDFRLIKKDAAYIANWGAEPGRPELITDVVNLPEYKGSETGKCILLGNATTASGVERSNVFNPANKQILTGMFSTVGDRYPTVYVRYGGSTADMIRVYNNFAANYMRLYDNSTTLVLEVSKTLDDDYFYNYKWDIDGEVYKYKVWKEGTTEPETWDIEYTSPNVHNSTSLRLEGGSSSGDERVAFKELYIENYEAGKIASSQAIQFDGVTGFANGPITNLATTNNFAVAFWAKTPSYDAAACWLHYWDGTRFFAFGSDDNGSGRILMRAVDDSTWEQYRPDEPTGWNHFIIQFDADGAVDGFYINLEKQINLTGSGGYTDVPFAQSGNLFTIARRGTAGDFANVEIQDLRLFDGQLEDWDRYFIYNNAAGTFDNTTLFKRFSGIVEEANPSDDARVITLFCKDNNDILTQRSITGTWYNIDLGQLYYTILAEKCREVDISGINTSTGIIIDKIQADARVIAELFDDLQNEYDYNLLIDDDLIAHLINDTNGDSGITLTQGAGGNVIKGGANLKNSNLSRKNAVKVIGGDEEVPAFDEPQQTWVTGNSRLIALSNIVDTLNFVKFNGVEMVEGTDFTLTTDRRFINLITILNGNTIDVRYSYLNPIYWTEQNPGVTKVRELVIKDPTVLTQARAEQLAKTMLAKLDARQVKGTVATDGVDKSFSKLQTINLNAVSGFTGSYTIAGYKEVIKDYYAVAFNLTEQLDDTTKKIFSIIKDIDKLKNADSTIATIRDGFTLYDYLGLSDSVIGYEQGIGDRWIFNHPTNAKMNDGKVMRTGPTYSTTPTQFL